MTIHEAVVTHATAYVFSNVFSESVAQTQRSGNVVALDVEYAGVAGHIVESSAQNCFQCPVVAQKQTGGYVHAEVGAAVPELYIPGYSFVGWKDAEGNPVEYYTAAASGLTLTAQWEAVKPGYNMLTGTTEKADFENGGRQYFYLGWVGSNGARSVESFTLGDNTRRVLRVSGVATQYPTLVWPVKLESDRPYTFVWDSYADLAINSFNI